MKFGDWASFPMSRRLIRQEGMLVGGSSGTAVAAAIQYIKEHNIGEGKRCVCVCADGIRNYMTKFLNADWMVENGFMNEEQCLDLNTSKLVENKDWGTDMKVSDLKLADIPTLTTSSTC